MSSNGSVTYLFLVGMALAALMMFKVATSFQPSEQDIAQAIMTGRVVKGMAEHHVIEVWGIPDNIVVGSRPQIGSHTSPQETSWIYRNPYRKVTFAEEGDEGQALVVSITTSSIFCASCK